MPTLFGRGGPLQGPRLLVALSAVLLLFFYLRSSNNAPQPETVVPIVATHKGQGAAPVRNDGHDGHNGHNGPPQTPSHSLGESPGEPGEEKLVAESMSDRLFDYLKGHSSHSQNSHSPIPHEEFIAPIPLASATAKPTAKDPICANLPDLSDLLVIVRTPASDLYSHLPAHFLTDLRCVDFLLYSTVHQNIGPYPIYDALANTSDSRRSKHKDFELYDKLQRAQNAVADLSVHKEDHEHNLDRWTILPHVLSTYRMRPDKKWFVFIESDSYLSVSNIMPWLNKLDHTRPVFAGAPVMIGDVELAHSGSGIVLSNAAVEKLAALAVDRMDAWEEAIGNSCCGDKILAEALREAGIRLHKSFPMIQGETPFSLDWSERHWCRPALTWHRISPQSLDMLFQFETAWVKKHAGSGEIPPMLFKDYFQTFLIPLIRQSQNRTDWDNLASSLTYTDQSRAQYAHYSFDACRAACDLRRSCVQYAWEPNKCRLGNVVRWGEQVSSDKRMMSGWMVQRVEKFGDTVAGTCDADDIYIMPGKEEPMIEEPPEVTKDALQLEEEQMEARAAEEERVKAEEKTREKALAELAAKDEAKEEGLPTNTRMTVDELERLEKDKQSQLQNVSMPKLEVKVATSQSDSEQSNEASDEASSKGLELSKKPERVSETSPNE